MYGQAWLEIFRLNASQHVVRTGWIAIVGLGLTGVSYPDGHLLVVQRLHGRHDDYSKRPEAEAAKWKAITFVIGHE